MRIFAFHVEDDRSMEPAIRKASLHGEFEARTLAVRILRETYHHRSIEVWESSRQLFAVTAEVG